MNVAPWGREAQLICRAPEVFMQTQSRQHHKFQSLLAGRAQFMRHNPTDTERALWFHLSGKKLGARLSVKWSFSGLLLTIWLPLSTSSLKLTGVTTRRGSPLMRGGIGCFSGLAIACLGLMLIGFGVIWLRWWGGFSLL